MPIPPPRFTPRVIGVLLVTCLSAMVGCAPEGRADALPPAAASGATSVPATPVAAPRTSLEAGEVAPSSDEAVDQALRPSAAFGARMRAAVDSLSPRVGIPMRVPAIVQGAPDDDSLYVTVVSAEAGAYDLVIGDANCRGGNYCRVGSATGRRVTADMPVVRGRRVAIPRIGDATYIASVCGANCSDAILAWERGGVRYTIGLKAGELEDLRLMAASIPSRPRQ